jgi:hypothetical protein
MHWTLGSLRDLQAFFWLRVFPLGRGFARQESNEKEVEQICPTSFHNSSFRLHAKR